MGGRQGQHQNSIVANAHQESVFLEYVEREAPVVGVDAPGRLSVERAVEVQRSNWIARREQLCVDAPQLSAQSCRVGQQWTGDADDVKGAAVGQKSQASGAD